MNSTTPSLSNTAHLPVGWEHMVEQRVFVSWRSPEGLVHPLGLLSRCTLDGRESFRFVYLKNAETLNGTMPLVSLPDLYKIYESEELFPVFRHRLMSRSRPDYPDYLQRLGLDAGVEPYEAMIRNEGRKLTDDIEVFAPPSRTKDGYLTSLSFVRGVCPPQGVSDAVTGLRPGDRLDIVDDPDNEAPPRVTLINPHNNEPVGWIADYLLGTIRELRDLVGEDKIVATAEHVNPPEVAPYMRLLCRLTAPWPENYEPMSGPEFQPIVS